MRIIRPGDYGEAVRDVQHRLLGLGEFIDPDELEGRFGPSTEAAVRAFQQKRGLPSDGLVAPDTWSRLVEAGYGLGDRTLYLRYPSFRGDDVRALQRRLNALGFDAGREDGIYGSRTDEAVREFQWNVGGAGDGIVGSETVAALGRLHRPVEGPGRAVVREAESLRRMESSLTGAAVAIDPGHGPGDPGNHGPGGTSEAEATMLLARELADELAARGAVPTLLRDADRDPTPSARAQAANELGAAVCISIHLNGGDPGAEGSTCFYFGTEGTYSPAGQRLAEVIQEELTSRLRLKDGRTHPLAVALLRETRMPAVQVEPSFITNPREEGLLLDGEFRRRVAEALTAGVERFFGAVGADRQAPDVTR